MHRSTKPAKRKLRGLFHSEQYPRERQADAGFVIQSSTRGAQATRVFIQS